MIEAKNLTKIFKSRHKEKCIAIDNVSFKLPNSGFVFAIGKSGSGKTTLLSLIGTLESITSGDILIDGISLKSLSISEQTCYRNDKIGFIFQDYHLLDELTIEDNVKLSLNLKGATNDSLVKEVLNLVDLDGYENRYPKELSGGEKQRVAIARTLIKNPDIILADEPTGNLDSKTSKLVLDLLKEYSKEHLVIIVSHNLIDAENYADRILELHDGKLVRNLIRNKEFKNEATIKNETLLLPLKDELNDKEVNLIKENSYKINKIIKNDKVFINNTEEITDVSNNFELIKHKVPFKKKAKLALKFLKQKLISTFVYAFILGLIVTVLGLTESLYMFDPDKVLSNELANTNDISYSLQKNKSLNTEEETLENLIPVDAEDLSKLKQVYKYGNVYELVNSTVFTEFGYNSKHGLKFSYNPINLYPMETRGTLICPESFLIKKYGKDNKLEFKLLADEIKDSGVYITDFFADGMLTIVNNWSHRYVYNSYNDIVGDSFGLSSNYTDIYINGIINTNYKERYNDVLKKYDKNKLTKEVYKGLSKNETFQNFLDEILKYLSVSYSFNENFKEDYKNSGYFRYFYCDILTNMNDVLFRDRSLIYNKQDFDNELSDNEVFISSSLFEKQKLTYPLDENGKLITPVSYKIQFACPYESKTTKVFLEKNVTLKGIIINDVDTIYCNNKTVCDLAAYRNCTFEYYFDDFTNINAVNKVGRDLGYKQNSVRYITLETMTKSVLAFKDIFEILYICLTVGVLIILVGFGLKTIKNRIYQIGVLKALGTRDLDLTNTFSLDLILLSLISTIIYILGSVVFLGVFNNILSESLISLTDSFIVGGVQFLYFNPLLVVINIAFMVGITLITFGISMIALRNVKPIKIIKAKE